MRWLFHNPLIVHALFPNSSTARCILRYQTFSTTSATQSSNVERMKKFTNGTTKRQHEDHSLPGRYATALFNVCQQKKILENVWSDFESLRICLIETPGIGITQKAEIIQNMTKEFKLTETTKHFLNLLLENRRLGYLKKMIDAFENFYRASRGEIKCVVTSASTLTEEQRKQVEKALEQRNSGHSLMVSFNVAPALLGGLLVRFGDQTLDYSVASRLARLQSELLVPLPY